MHIGFVGLGAMGLPMTRHLVEAGHDVTVSSRSRPPIDTAVAFGATEADGPRSVVEASHVTIVCVPRTHDVEEVVEAALPAARDKVLVDTSTIAPDAERALHERVTVAGGSYLEAPLSGGTVGAEKGTLTLMVGGGPEVLDRARPALEPFAGLVVHCGGPGMGQVAKLCNQLIYAAQMLATAEAAALAERSGLDHERLVEILLQSTGDCTAVRTRYPVEGVLAESPASNGWKPGFMTDLMAKDLDLAIEYAAAAQSPLFTSGIVRQLLGAASRAGYGREDFSALAKVVRQLGA